MGLASFHRCRREGFQKSNTMTSLHSGYPKTRSKNAQVVSRCQRDPQMTKKNRGKQFKTREKQNKLESYLNPEKSGRVDPQILFPFSFSPRISSLLQPLKSLSFLCFSLLAISPPLSSFRFSFSSFFFGFSRKPLCCLLHQPHFSAQANLPSAA